MGFRRWLLQNRLTSTERKLKKLRANVARIRKSLDEAHADKAKLEEQRHRLTAEIDALVGRERQLKDELRGIPP